MPAGPPGRRRCRLSAAQCASAAGSGEGYEGDEFPATCPSSMPTPGGQGEEERREEGREGRRKIEERRGEGR